MANATRLSLVTPRDGNLKTLEQYHAYCFTWTRRQLHPHERSGPLTTHSGSTRPPHCHVTTAQLHYALDETGAES